MCVCVVLRDRTQSQDNEHKLTTHSSLRGFHSEWKIQRLTSDPLWALCFHWDDFFLQFNETTHSKFRFSAMILRWPSGFTANKTCGLFFKILDVLCSSTNSKSTFDLLTQTGHWMHHAGPGAGEATHLPQGGVPADAGLLAEGAPAEDGHQGHPPPPAGAGQKPTHLPGYPGLTAPGGPVSLISS